MKVLSIDWDYFMDFNKDYMWDGSYHDWTRSYAYYMNELKGSTLNYSGISTVKNIISNNLGAKFYVAEEHGKIYDIIYNLKGEEVEVYNIDQHHDCFDTNKGKPGLENWVVELHRNNVISKYTWIKNNRYPKRDDFDEVSEDIGEEVMDVKKGLKFLTNMEFDIIFICRSDFWSMPHLDHRFKELLDCIPYYTELEEIEERNYREMYDLDSNSEYDSDEDEWEVRYVEESEFMENFDDVGNIFLSHY